MSADKIVQRKAFRSLRQNLSQEEIANLSLAIEQQFKVFKKQLRLKKVALYWPFDQEVDAKLLIPELWQDQIETYLPRLRPDQSLEFALYSADTRCQANRFGIPEPKDPAKLASLETLDLLLIPLLAFDLQGHRLGMGAGFYDRTLSKIATHPKRALFLGLAYEIQKADSLCTDPWDIRLDAVMTEKHIYYFNEQGPL